ncbi:hypothetical protein PIB30_054878 [Stylosanthes scabra]|uniref:Uncharacterized protein n=1 Tax=Stylosanthes scabra TaxID=79078 RepID=A0ABU6XKH0_9FABA|nr:hypothetical protein [Stylosanthes scabra]
MELPSAKNITFTTSEPKMQHPNNSKQGTPLRDEVSDQQHFLLSAKVAAEIFTPEELEKLKDLMASA